MLASPKRILTIGLTAAASAAVKHLEREGWKKHAVETLCAGENALESGTSGIVLAAEELADGGGYDLIETVKRHAGTLLVAVTLSDSCVWVPVVERGTKTLGRPALHPQMLESVLLEVIISGKRSTDSGRMARARKRAKSKTPNPLHDTSRAGAEFVAGLGRD